jgi:hypothetical protein
MFARARRAVGFQSYDTRASPFLGGSPPARPRGASSDGHGKHKLVGVRREWRKSAPWQTAPAITRAFEQCRKGPAITLGYFENYQPMIMSYTQARLAGLCTCGPAGAQEANQLNHTPEPCYPFRVSTLAEIEDAADALPPEQKQELFLFLAARLRGGVGQAPPPREFTQEQVKGWIADDEAGMRRFREER